MRVIKGCSKNECSFFVCAICFLREKKRSNHKPNRHKPDTIGKNFTNFVTNTYQYRTIIFFYITIRYFAYLCKRIRNKQILRI